MSPIYGYIFLFKWQPDKREGLTILDEVPGLFYAKQEITNACATQAIISVLMNRPEIELGETLKNFKDFSIASGLPPKEIGQALGGLDAVRIAHNSFRRQDPFQIVADKNDEKDDAFHFISYVPHSGVLYELDGLQRGPILHGECTNENWLEKVKPVIQARMAEYQASEMRFTLLAITKKLKTKYLEEQEQLKEAQAELKEGGMEEEAELMDERLNELAGLISSEDEKFANWKRQNIRRRHNYIPFLLELLKKSAYNGLLPDLIEEAGNRKKEKIAAMEARKEKENKA